MTVRNLGENAAEERCNTTREGVDDSALLTDVENTHPEGEYAGKTERNLKTILGRGEGGVENFGENIGLPKGKKLFGWIFFRCLTVVIGMALHLVVVYLFNRFLPEGLAMYAPTVLLALLIILILTGSLKLIVGLMVSSVNPVIGGLYTFFFANAIGRLITRAVLTTAILMLLVYLLNWLGIFALSIAAAALVAYIPFLLIALGLWYLIGKIF